MPGLVVSLDPSIDLAAGIDNLRHEQDFSAKTYSFDLFQVVQIIGSALAHTHHTSPGGVTTWVYGPIYPRRGAEPLGYDERQSAAFACQQYEQHGLAFADHLNGDFNLVLWDAPRRRLLIANDRFAMRPWYEWRERLLAPEIKGLLPYLPQTKLDPLTLGSLLAFKNIRLGDNTLIEGVKVLPAASLWEWQADHLEKRTYWIFRYHDDAITIAPASRETLNELVDSYKHAVRCRAGQRPDRRVGISLSGGLDSRAIVAALGRANRQYSAHTWGMFESDEIDLAWQAAAQTRHHIYPLDPQDYPHYARKFMQIMDDIDIFVQGAQLRALYAATTQVDVLFSGLVFNATMGGSYLSEAVLAAQTDTDVLALLKRSNAVFGADELPRLLTPQQKGLADVYGAAEELIAKLPQQSAPAKYDLFFHNYGVRRVTTLRYKLYHHVMEAATPVYDYDFMDILLTLPLRQRARHRAYVPFLKKLSPKLAQVPYQRTLLPANAPPEFWGRAMEIEAQREQLYTDIWRETKGQVYIPYRRYYSNFDEWLRLDPAWQRFTDEMLLNPNAAIYQLNLIQPDYVAELVAQHRRAQRNTRQRLVVLMSLELYLRVYF